MISIKSNNLRNANAIPVWKALLHSSSWNHIKKKSTNLTKMKNRCFHVDIQVAKLSPRHWESGKYITLDTVNNVLRKRSRSNKIYYKSSLKLLKCIKKTKIWGKYSDSMESITSKKSIVVMNRSVSIVISMTFNLVVIDFK